MMPSDLMPGWVQAIASGNPMTWAVEAARASLSGDAASIAWWQLIALVALVALAFAWAVRSIRSYQRSI
jgi:ABC-2 type transport system permease protein